VPLEQLQVFIFGDIIAAGYDVGYLFVIPMPAYLLESLLDSIYGMRELRMITYRHTAHFGGQSGLLITLISNHI
jgi:hypothetical protein